MIRVSEFFSMSEGISISDKIIWELDRKIKIFEYCFVLSAELKEKRYWAIQEEKFDSWGIRTLALSDWCLKPAP